MSNQLTLQFLGGSGTVTGSKFLLTAGEDRFLLDCGLFQGLKEYRLRNWAPLPIRPKELRAVILTHAHIDHSGFLPKFVQQGFRGDVYATPATCDLLRVLLPDAAHLQEEEARYANQRGYSKHKPALSLYTVEDAYRSLDLLRRTNYSGEVELAQGVSLRFFRTGHILGAAAVRITLEIDGRKRHLVDSGDLGRYHRPILRDPEPVGQADWLLVESTYGDRIHPDKPEEELARVIHDVAEERGCLIIPSFAVGRTQELIYDIRQLEDQGRIPSLPVYVDSPMVINATEIYCSHPEEHDLEMKLLMDEKVSPFCSRKFRLVRSPEESKTMNSLFCLLIIVSASGMASGGRVLHHLRLRLPDPRTTVLLVGYQAAGTRGRSLQEGATTIRIHGTEVPVRAHVEMLDGFSAHADQQELFRWLSAFTRKPRQGYLVHGEPPAAANLADALHAKFG